MKLNEPERQILERHKSWLKVSEQSYILSHPMVRDPFTALDFQPGEGGELNFCDRDIN